jgi:hypothetical protein
VTETPNSSTINLLEVNTRAEHARHIVAGFSRGAPTLADLWGQVYDSLSDIPYLATEITNLRERLTLIRIERANLAAAGRISIVAFRNGESDPLSYLQDELHAQGFGAGREGA